MNALTDIQSRLLEEYCIESGVPMSIDVIKRRMCAFNGLTGGLIACSSGGSINGDAVIAMEAYCCLFGIADMYDESMVDEAIRLAELDPPEKYLPRFGG